LTKKLAGMRIIVFGKGKFGKSTGVTLMALVLERG
jgi:hypothetical protein